MGPTATLLLGAAIVAVIGTLGVWLTLQRPNRRIERRQRDEALAAAAHYTPAERPPVYGGEPDPCAAGLTDSQRVLAMRALLLRGDQQAAQSAGDAFADLAFAPTQPLDTHDAGPTTSPMAWKPTRSLEDEQGDEPGLAPRRPLNQPASEEREHITL